MGVKNSSQTLAGTPILCIILPILALSITSKCQTKKKFIFLVQQRKCTITTQFKLKKLTDKNKKGILLIRWIFSLVAQLERKEN